jgi:cyclase
VLTELKPGVYVETGFEGGNIGMVMTDQGALLIDTPMLPPDARAWSWVLHDLQATRIYGIVNTDHHLERILGNAQFMPTRLWGHESAIKQIAKLRSSGLEQLANAYDEADPRLADELRQVELYDPELCVSDRATLHLDRRIEIHYLNGHTSASLAIYLPEERILFAGDNLVCNEHPVLAQANSAAWLQSLKRIQNMAVDMIIPGSGDPCGKEAIDPLAAYIAEMRQRVSEMYASGASRRECVDKVGMLDFFVFADEEAARVKRRRRESIERIYAEIRTAQPRR